MTGKIAVIAIVLASILMGAGVWYAQVYAFYEELTPEAVAAEITATRPDGSVTPLTVASAEGIDGTSSPIKWRACFTLAEAPDPATLVPFEGATPLIGPGWFPCYDAGIATEALERGEAKAYLSRAEVRPDVDRVIVLWPDGRGMGWHQINDKTPEPGVMD